MITLRLKKEKETASRVYYSEGFAYSSQFGRHGFHPDTLRQWFGGQVPAEIEIEIRAVVHEENGRAQRNEAMQVKRETVAQRAEDMQIQGALERLARKLGG